MRSYSLMVALIALALLGFACAEPFSNDDILFLKSLPNEAFLKIEIPKAPDVNVAGNGVRADGLRPAQTGTTTQAVFYRYARRISQDLNQNMFFVLEIVKDVTRHPPTQREEDLRIWGPWSDNGGPQLLLAVNRRVETRELDPLGDDPVTVDVSYDYVMRGQSPGSEEWLDLFGGTFAPVASEDRGVGGFWVNFEAARMLNPDAAERGVFAVGYDTRTDRVRLAMAYDNPLISAEGVQWDDFYRFEADSEGNIDFLFATLANIHENNPALSKLEFMLVLARWRGDNNGRADVALAGGDLMFPVRAYECWNEDFVRVYYEPSIEQGLGQPVGTPLLCYPGLQEPLDPDR